MAQEKQKFEGELTRDTVLGPLVKKYPYIRKFLISLNPKYKKLKNPILFKTMSGIANLAMIAERGEMVLDELLLHLNGEIQRREK